MQSGGSLPRSAWQFQGWSQRAVAKISRPVFADFVIAFTHKKHSDIFNDNYNGYFADGLRAASEGGDQPQNSHAASVIVDALNGEGEANMRQSLALGLRQSRNTCRPRRPIRYLCAALGRESDSVDPSESRA